MNISSRKLISVFLSARRLTHTANFTPPPLCLCYKVHLFNYIFAKTRWCYSFIISTLWTLPYMYNNTSWTDTLCIPLIIFRSRNPVQVSSNLRFKAHIPTKSTIQFGFHDPAKPQANKKTWATSIHRINLHAIYHLARYKTVNIH